MFQNDSKTNSNKASTLETGQPDDKFEQEANAVADKVMMMPEQPSSGDGGKLRMQPMSNDLIQMKCTECSEEELRMKPAVDAEGIAEQAAPAGLSDQVRQSGGGGKPLPPNVREEMGHKMGADFTDVAVHTGSSATQMNDALGAKAFTHRNNIFFNSNEFNPHTNRGKHLLAHELTHVIQQKEGAVSRRIQRDPEDATASESGTSSSLVDTVLPTGSGFYFDIAAGITWGIPVYTGGTVRGEIYRESDQTVVLIIYKQGRIGGDTGAGAGFYIGTPRRGRSGSSSSFGVGVDAGVHAEAGLQASVIEQYNIPVDEFLAALTATAGDQALSIMRLTPATAPFAMAADQFLQEFAQRYLVRTNYEFGLYAEATAEVTAGGRRGTEHARDVEGGESSPARTQGAEGWTSGERRNPSEAPRATDLDPMALLNWLSIVFTAQVSGEVNFGVDLDKRGDNEVVKLYGEGQLQALLELPIPFLSEIISILPSGAGLGIELLFEFENDQISGVKLNVYQFSGEDEIFQGSANKQTMTVNLLNVVDIDQILQSLSSGQVPSLQQSTNFNIQNMLETTEYWHRFSLLGPIGRRFRTFLRRQQGTRSLLSDRITQRSTAIGLRFEPYFTVKFNIPGPDFLRIVQMVPAAAAAGQQAMDEESGLVEKIQRLGEFMTDYEDPDLAALIEEILDSAVVSVAELRILFGAGIGVSGRLAEGAKVRGDLAVEGGAFCGKDLLEGGERNLREVLLILHEVLDNPTEHLPNCPFIGELYSGDTVGPETDGGGTTADETEDQTPGEATGGDRSSTDQNGDVGTEDSGVRVVEQAATNEMPDEGISRRVVTQVQISSNSLTRNAEVSQDETDVHACRLYFSLDGQVNAVQVLLRVLGNDRESNSLHLEFVEDVWMEAIQFGFEEGTRFSIPYNALIASG